MKKLFFFLLPLLAAGWLLPMGGCKKCKGIEGKVLEFGTETPIKDATVTLSDCTGGIGDPLVCTDVATKVTGSDGRFHFGADGFSVAAKAPGYWDTGDDFEMVINECPKPVLYLYPEARLQIRVKNESGAYSFHAFGEDFFLSKGEESSTKLIVAKGNEEFRVNFWVESYLGDSTILESSKNVKIIDDYSGLILQPNFDNMYAFFLKVYLKGHKTTKITITY